MLQSVRQRQPQARILLLGLSPEGWNKDDARWPATLDAELAKAGITHDFEVIEMSPLPSITPKP